MTNWTEQLFGLLPAVYQTRDAEQGQPLRQLLGVIGEQVQLVEQDIDRLYDNWFVETCDPWLVPYLGELVGQSSSASAAMPSSAALVRNPQIRKFLYPRREIANLVQRRRRKGTLSVLEDVAGDVTGWRARAVEFSRLVNFAQHARHPQPHLGRTMCVRDNESTIRLNAPFDRMAHTVDVRDISSSEPQGWYHPRKVGLFVWRRNVYSATKVTPGEICVSHDKHVQAYTFNRLGIRQALAIKPRNETDDLSIASERHLPVPLFRHLLSDPKTRTASTDYYGLDDERPRSLVIEALWNEQDVWRPIPACHVHVRSLTDECEWGAIAQELCEKHVALDPECGIFLFKPCKRPCAVRVTYHYTCATAFGGGEYSRLSYDNSGHPTIRIRQSEGCTAEPPNLFEEVCRAFENTDDGPCGTKLDNPLQRCEPCASKTDKSERTTWTVASNLCIEILGSGTFQISANETLQIPDGVTLEIRAASGSWPLVHLRSTNLGSCGNPWTVLLGRESRLILDGLQICGATMRLEDRPADEISPTATDGCDPNPCTTLAAEGSLTFQPFKPTRIVIRHTTFVPGGRAAAVSCGCRPNHASITARVTDAQLTISHSIVGTLNIEHPKCQADKNQPGHACPCPQDALALRIFDSIVDASDGRMAVTGECCWPAHADLQIERCTILGDICLQQITRAEDCLFCGVVHVQRRGIGYMRFCYVPSNWPSIPKCDDRKCCRRTTHLDQWKKWLGLGLARGPSIVEANCPSIFRTPIRFKCLEGMAAPLGFQTDSECTDCGNSKSAKLATTHGRELPRFVGTRYGHAGYCELALDCPSSIVHGAEDEGELGVFHDLYSPQRRAALAARLTEYTPAEMESAVIYADDLYPPAVGCHTCDSTSSR